MEFRHATDIRAEPNIRDDSHPGAYIDATVQSQYAASPKIVALARGFAWLEDTQPDTELFYAAVFDIMTAYGWGLDNWGRILGMGRFLDYPGDDFLGFQFSQLQPIDQAPFYNPGALQTLRLDDASYRQLLLWKALANISAADAATLNDLLNRLFAAFAVTEPVYVIEVGVMRIRLVLEFALSNQLFAAIRHYGLLGKGAGVGVELLVAPRPCFGFAGSELHPFDHGLLWDGDVLTIN